MIDRRPAVLVHPWDSAEDKEWRAWLADRDFGQLIAGGRDRDVPIAVPTHFVFDGERTVRLHLARPNPVWEPLTEHPRAVLTVVDDYTYIRSDWNTAPGGPVERGVPTSYYATVQLTCDVRVIDDPAEKAALLDRQLAHFEPGSARLPVSAEEDPDRRLLPGIRGIELTVTDVRAKFKYGGNKEPEHVREIADRLEERGTRADIAARDHALRRV
jgi:transcriptional regulator